MYLLWTPASPSHPINPFESEGCDRHFNRALLNLTMLMIFGGLALCQFVQLISCFLCVCVFFSLLSTVSLPSCLSHMLLHFEHQCILLPSTQKPDPNTSSCTNVHSSSQRSQKLYYLTEISELFASAVHCLFYKPLMDLNLTSDR